IGTDHPRFSRAGRRVFGDETQGAGMAKAAATRFEKDAAKFVKSFRRIQEEIAKVIVGQERLVEDVLTALAAGGHVLLEGVPGIGKTLLVHTLADAIDCRFARIQFTPDLMPSDII